jgi:tetratricopeptide (TPR) repeat protein
VTSSSACIASVALFAASFVFTEPARAGSAEADAAFARGTRAYQHGDNRGAAEAFETAYRLEPHGIAKYSAALAWEAAGEQARAADDYALALASGQLDAKQKKDAQERLRKLEQSLGRIEVRGPRGTTIEIEHIDGAPVPLTTYLSPGEHTLEARFPDGSTRQTSVKVSAGQNVQTELEPAPHEEPSAPTSRAGAPVRGEERPVEPSNSQKTVGYVMVGGAAAASLAAVYLGARALSARDEFNDSGFRDADAHDRAASLRTATNVSWGVAGVLAITGGVLLITAPKKAESAARRIGVRVGPLSASLRGTF